MKSNRRKFLCSLAAVSLPFRSQGQDEDAVREALDAPIDFRLLEHLQDLDPGSEGPGVIELQKYLARFGGLKMAGIKSGTLDEPTVAAIKEFKAFHGLAGRGMVDRELRELLLETRCGMPDRIKPLFEAIGPWPDGKRDFTYQFVTPPSRGPRREEVAKEIDRAFNTWADAGQELKFTKVNRKPDILLEWVPAAHRDATLDRKTCAHADYPPGHGELSQDLPRPVHFNDELDWRFGGELDIQSVALHEIGHVLGLGHKHTNRKAVMDAYFGGVKRKLDEDDKNGLRKLYP